MLLATVQDATGRKREITRCKGATAPACISSSPLMCGYWESRLELFLWACDVAHMNPYGTQWLDGFTGELLTHDELEAEHFDEYPNTDSANDDFFCTAGQ